MLTFFRRIRKGLLGDGATSKYLLYAVGEILLVMIGILLALQVNNWNEGRKEQLQIKTYLSNLVDAIKDDIGYLYYTQTGNRFRAECLKYLLLLSTGESPKSVPDLKYELDNEFDGDSGNIWSKPQLENPWLEKIPRSYDRAFTEICFERTTLGNIIVVNQSTLEEFKNTDLFSYIENEKLRRQINDYYANMSWRFSDWREANYREALDEWDKFLRHKYLINTQDISHVDDPIALIKDNKELQLEMEELASDAAARANYAGKSMLAAKELIKVIEAEILKIERSAG